MVMNADCIRVVIVSYNTRELLLACLDSLLAIGLPLQIHVVDNASHDGSADQVALAFPQVQLTRLCRNVGFAAANNIALRSYSTLLTGYYLLLNPDTAVHSGALEALAAFLDRHPRVGLVGPRLLNPDGSLQPAAFRFPTLAMAALDLFPPGEVLPGRLYNSHWQGRYAAEQHASQPFPIDHPLGACMLVRGQALAEAGLFDEQFFIYSEEVDLCYRLQQRGWAIWQVPSAVVTHVGGAATSQFRRRMFVELHRSRVQFAAKHYSQAYLRRYRLIVRAGLLRLQALAWRSYWQGQIDRDEQARLLGYAEVGRL
jgi:N-acetylglucosaminyl-diphospho-decaprenol L-rhamnosyltransferase